MKADKELTAALISVVDKIDRIGEVGGCVH